jgi:uncharacterized protein
MGDGILLNSRVVTPRECLHYAMSLPVSVVITGCDSLAILEQALVAARDFKPLTAAERSALLAKAKIAAESGKYELYKTANVFDSTERNPEWLGRG